MSNGLTVIALIGMTSAGKTAVLRTLLQRSDLGEIGAETGTTENANEYTLLEENEVPVLTITDTPGFQKVKDFRSLLSTKYPGRGFETLSAEEIGGAVPRGEEDYASDYRHDAVSWNQIVQSDLVLCVIDLTEDPDAPRFSSQLDLLPFLSAIERGKKPVVILLNKTKMGDAETFLPRWKERLRETGFRRVVEYDAHDHSLKNEKTLFTFLSQLTDPPVSTALQKLLSVREKTAKERLDASIREAARWLTDLARQRRILKNLMPEQERRERARLERQLFDDIQQKESAFIKKIFEIWETETETEGNLHESIRRQEIGQEGVCVAAGAAVGTVVDIASLGATLGVGTVLGAAVGEVAWKCREQTKKIFSPLFSNRVFLVPEVALLESALDRAVWLIQSLRRRGYGDSSPIELHREPVVVPGVIDRLKALSNPDWTADLLSAPKRTVQKFWGPPGDLDKDAEFVREKLHDWFTQKENTDDL